MAVAAMAEEGMASPASSLSDWSMRRLPTPTLVVTMGWGDAGPYFPGKRYEDWVLDDPAAQFIDKVRAIRDQIHDIHDRVLRLIAELLPRAA